MKKLTLLIATLIIASGVNAKMDKHNTTDRSATTPTKADVAAMVPGSAASMLDAQLRHAAKATNVVIGSVETFGSGTATTMPTGWTTTNLVNSQKFYWHDTTTTVGAIPKVIGSPSRGDGFMIIDANSNAASTAHATLTSPTYNMTGHAHVGLVFNHWFERFRDSLWVEVTNNNFAASTNYPVYLDNTLASNGSTRNTDTVVIDISAVAANNATVQVRFHYYGATQAYGCAIDDMRFVDLDAVNTKLHRSSMMFAIDSSQNFFWGVGTLPKQFLTFMIPLTYLYNQGYTAQPSASVTADITGGTPNYNHNASINLAINGYDSAADYGSNYFLPTQSATYSCVFTSTGTSDTTRFALSDSSWTNLAPTNISRGAYYLHRPSSHPAGEHSWNYATRLFVPGGKADTITSFNGSFYYTTTPGSRVIFQVYKFNTATTTWDLFGQSYSRALGSSDISAQGIPTYSGNFYPDPVFNTGPIVLSGDITAGYTQYAVVATTDHVPAASEVTLYVSNAAQFTGYFSVAGLEDSSDNQAGTTFNNNIANTTNQTPWTFEFAPMIKVNFGNYYVMPNDVNTISSLISTDNAYPNPANNTVAITFNLLQDANTTVTVQNTLGQVVRSNNLGSLTTKQTAKTTFATGDLANGVYFYTINANGQQKTGRFVIAH